MCGCPTPPSLPAHDSSAASEAERLAESGQKSETGYWPESALGALHPLVWRMGADAADPARDRSAGYLAIVRIQRCVLRPGDRSPPFGLARTGIPHSTASEPDQIRSVRSATYLGPAFRARWVDRSGTDGGLWVCPRRARICWLAPPPSSAMHCQWALGLPHHLSAEVDRVLTSAEGCSPSAVVSSAGVRA